MDTSIFAFIGLIGVFIASFSALPQIFKTYKTRSAKDISLSLYVLRCVGVSLSLIYIIHLNIMIYIVGGIASLIFIIIMIVFKLKYS